MYSFAINNNITVYGSRKTIKGIEDSFKAQAEVKARNAERMRDVKALTEMFRKLNTYAEADFALGHEIYSLGHEMWHDLPAEVKEGVSYIFDKKPLSVYIARYVALHPEVTEAQCRRGFEASELAEYYSDFHKDVYGVRP